MLCRLATGTYVIPLPLGGEWDTTVPGVNTSANVFISSATGIGQLVKDIKKSYRYLYWYDFDLIPKSTGT